MRATTYKSNVIVSDKEFIDAAVEIEGIIESNLKANKIEILGLPFATAVVIHSRPMKVYLYLYVLTKINYEIEGFNKARTIYLYDVNEASKFTITLSKP